MTIEELTDVKRTIECLLEQLSPLDKQVFHNIAMSAIYIIDKQIYAAAPTNSCIDKHTLIKELDDKRIVGMMLNKDMWYFCRKETAEFLLGKYKIIPK